MFCNLTKSAHVFDQTQVQTIERWAASGRHQILTRCPRDSLILLLCHGSFIRYIWSTNLSSIVFPWHGLWELIYRNVSDGGSIATGEWVRLGSMILVKVIKPWSMEAKGKTPGTMLHRGGAGQKSKEKRRCYKMGVGVPKVKWQESEAEKQRHKRI